jgi:3-oxoisoapionate kinase
MTAPIDPHPQRTLVAFYGDDFTGSSENLAQLCRTGLRGRLFFETADPALIIAEARTLDVVGIAGTARALSPETMAPALSRAFATLQAIGPGVVQYKVCSTFDSSRRTGNFAVAIQQALARWPGAIIPVSAATPGFGRYTAFSNHFANHDGSVLRLDRNAALRDHPSTPMREADLRRHLIDLGCARVEAIHWPELGGDITGLLLDRGANSVPVVIDGMSDDDMIGVAAAIWRAKDTQPVFALAAQGLAGALGEVITREQGIAGAPAIVRTPTAVDRMLVLSGSCSVQTGRQLEAAQAAGWAMIEIPRDRMGTPSQSDALADELSKRVVAELGGGRSVAAFSARGNATVNFDSARTRALGDVMARICRRAVTEAGLRRVIFAGGDTSSYAMTSIGADALDLVAFDARSNCHVFRLRARDELDQVEVLLKGGQVGGDDFFLEALGSAPAKGSRRRRH